MTAPTLEGSYMVWREGQLIGAGFKTAAEAKSYAKRNASSGQMAFTVGRGKVEYRATFSMNSRAQWEPI